ncbi:hypothetical protein NHX12_009535 [Muraenolepis orangiensis]|uniref:Uncharacterized protein n=1 Tax=Muraenolepis orangiensis TaxID=630683 RepID=A0A9Q0DHZ5_9TELE|nr:hypothetical protein NHX12_009535 [Muraenolepis orangiensis]
MTTSCLLNFVFGSCAVQALDLVDNHSVTCLSSPSGRKTFQVTRGESSKQGLNGPVGGIACDSGFGQNQNIKDGTGDSNVTGGSGRAYTCFTSCHYCPCPAFAYAVLRRDQGLLILCGFVVQLYKLL